MKRKRKCCKTYDHLWQYRWSFSKPIHWCSMCGKLRVRWIIKNNGFFFGLKQIIAWKWEHKNPQRQLLQSMRQATNKLIQANSSPEAAHKYFEELIENANQPKDLQNIYEFPIGDAADNIEKPMNLSAILEIVEKMKDER